MIIGSHGLMWTSYVTEYNKWTEQIKNLDWQETDHSATYKRSRGVEQGTTWNKSRSWWPSSSATLPLLSLMSNEILKYHSHHQRLECQGWYIGKSERGSSTKGQLWPKLIKLSWAFFLFVFFVVVLFLYLDGIKYLLLTEFEGRTVSYGLRVFHFNYAKQDGHEL